MGTCKSQHVSTTTFPEKYIFPQHAKHYDIAIAGFTDMWEAINDWSLQSGTTAFKQRLEVYTKANVCMEPNVVILYGGQTWVFHTHYNTGSNKYRIIQL